MKQFNSFLNKEAVVSNIFLNFLVKQWFLDETISDFQFECCGVRSKSDYGLHGVKVPESCGTSVREKIAREVRNFLSFYILVLATSFPLLHPCYAAVKKLRS